jgi:hypothetical protein
MEFRFDLHFIFINVVLFTLLLRIIHLLHSWGCLYFFPVSRLTHIHLSLGYFG